MKIKTMMAAATAALLFASCSKDDQGETPVVVGESQSVTISIQEEEVSRAIGAPEVVAVVTFSEGQLYFANAAGVIRHIYNIHPTNPTNVNDATPGTTINMSDINATGFEIKNIKGDVTEAVIVGNHTPIGLTATVGSNISGVKKKAILPGIQTNAAGNLTNATLYGAGTLTTPVPATPEKKEVSMSLKPHVARIELVDITGSGNITAFDVEGVFVNNYYESINGDRSLIAAPKNHGQGGATIYGDNTGAYATGSPFYTWSATNFGNTSTNLTKTVDGVLPTSTKVWAYNVLAPEGAGLQPSRLIIALNNVLASGFTFTGPQFVTVKGFKDSSSQPVTHFEAGNIYSIDAASLVFDETNVGGTAEAKDIDVTVKVTKVTWARQSITPEL